MKRLLVLGASVAALTVGASPVSAVGPCALGGEQQAEGQGTNVIIADRSQQACNSFENQSSVRVSVTNSASQTNTRGNNSAGPQSNTQIGAVIVSNSARAGQFLIQTRGR